MHVSKALACHMQESTIARTDIFGQPATQKVLDEVACMNCGRHVVAVRCNSQPSRVLLQILVPCLSACPLASVPQAHASGILELCLPVNLICPS